MNCEAVHDKFENHHPLNKNEIDFIAYIYNTNYISHSLPDLLYITLTYEILNFALIIPPATKLRGYYVFVPSVRPSDRSSPRPQNDFIALALLFLVRFQKYFTDLLYW